MALQYVVEYVRDLESKFDFLVRVLFEKLMRMNLEIIDITSELQRLPFSLQQQYSYLWENAEQVAAESASVKEYMLKMSSGINFINSRTLVEYMLELYADNVEIKYMKSFFNDLQRKLSKISVPEFETSLVSLPLKSLATITLELDSIWYHKSMEDLMKFQRSFPFRNWYFMKVVVVNSSIRVLYGVQRNVRLYRVELSVLRSHGVVRIFGGDRLIATCSPQYKLKNDLTVCSIYNKYANEVANFGIYPQPGLIKVKMSRDRLSSEKEQKALYRPCTFYTKQALRNETVFEVESSLNTLEPAAHLIIGLHRISKGEKMEENPTSLLPYECRNYCVWHDGTLWDNFSLVHTTRSYGNIHLTDILPKSRVGLTINSLGDLMFYVDGKCQGLAATGVYDNSSDVHAVVTMLEGCQSIRVVKAVTNKESL